MKSEWSNKKIKDVVDIRRGASPRPIHNFLANNGMPWVKIADATADSSRYLWKTNEYIIYEGIKKSVVVEPETLIVSNSATPGLPKIMKITACVHDGWLVFSNYRGITRDFLYYKFIDIRRKLVNQANGSVFQNLKTDIVKDFDIDIPSIQTQNKIVDILSRLDDKIELNNAINENLEQQALALFSNYYEHSTTEVGFTDLIQVLGGGTPKTGERTYWNGNIPFFTPKDIDCPYTLATEKTITDDGLSHCNSRLYPVNTVFVTARGTVGKVGIAGVPMAMNQSCYALIGKGIHQLLAYFYTLKVVDRLKHKASGAVFDAIITKDFETEQVVKLFPNDADTFIKIAEPMYQFILNNSIENQRLIALRNSLLPKLMSSELDVSGIQL